jgi:hypothetical protein
MLDQQLLNLDDHSSLRISTANGLIELDFDQPEAEICFQSADSKCVWFFPLDFKLETDPDLSSGTWKCDVEDKNLGSHRTSASPGDLPLEYEIDELSVNRVRIHVQATQAAKMLFSKLSDSGWHIQVINRDTGETFDDCQIPAGAFFLGAKIPRGNIDVVYQYRPIEFWIGAWISSISWLLLLAVGLIRGSGVLVRGSARAQVFSG